MVNLRPATIDDADALGAVHVQCWHDAYTGVLPPAVLNALSVPERQQRWRKTLADARPLRHWLAVDDGVVVGFCSIGPCRDQDSAGKGEIFAIYLLKAYWDRGIGRRLMGLALKRLSGEGFGHALLWVLGDNARTRRFYEQAGFVPDGATRQTQRGEHATHEVRYARELARTAIIRPMVLADARPLAELHVRAWQVAYRGILPQDVLDRQSVSDREGYRVSDVNDPDPDKRCWTADVDGRPVGFAVSGKARDAELADAAEVYAIYLDPAAWGGGAGRELMSHTLADLRSRGWPRASVWVLRDNARARRFYEQAGFMLDGAARCKQWMGADFNEVRYTCELAPVIRPAAVYDAEALAAMHMQARRDAYTGIVPEESLAHPPAEKRVEGWRESLQAPPTGQRTWLAEHGGRVVGFAGAGPSRDDDCDPAATGEIQSIYLLKDYWGTGLGRRLMKVAVGHLAGLKVREVTLWVLRDNTRARRFYQAAGFNADGMSRDKLRSGVSLNQVRYRANLEDLQEEAMFDRFSHVMLFVKDIQRAVGWYKSTLGFVENFASPHFASLRHDAMKCRIDLHPSEANSKDVGFGPMPYFAARDFDKALAALKAKGVKTGEPRREGDSPRFVSFWDSEGNALGIEEAR